MRWDKLTVIAVGLASAARPTNVAAQGSPCLTSADTAAIYIQSVTLDVTAGDSTRLVSLGLPYRPAGGVSLVTDAVLCQAIVDAYNALDTLPTHPARISRAYVMRVGSSAYAMVGEKKRSVYVYFDTAYHWLAALVSMH